MNVGPGGFADAPVTKAVVLASAAASILASAGGNAASNAPRLLPAPLAAAVSALSFASAGETLSGLSVLYNARVLERESGTGQYGAYAAVVAGGASLLQAALSVVVAAAAGAGAGAGGASSPSSSSAPFSLPLAFAFAGLVPYAADVPPQARFNLLGVPCTDKVFSYLAAAHACWAAGARRGLLAACCGLAAGLLYRLNVFGVQRLRLPRWLVGGGGGASGPPPRVLVPPVLEGGGAGGGDGDDLFFGGGMGGGGTGGGGGRGGGGAERLQARPQMMRRRR
jgi:hypothetical protein